MFLNPRVYEKGDNACIGCMAVLWILVLATEKTEDLIL